jgi:hypothetical protein
MPGTPTPVPNGCDATSITPNTHQPTHQPTHQLFHLPGVLLPGTSACDGHRTAGEIGEIWRVSKPPGFAWQCCGSFDAVAAACYTAVAIVGTARVPWALQGRESSDPASGKVIAKAGFENLPPRHPLHKLPVASPAADWSAPERQIRSVAGRRVLMAKNATLALEARW